MPIGHPFYTSKSEFSMFKHPADLLHERVLAASWLFVGLCFVGLAFVDNEAYCVMGLIALVVVLNILLKFCWRLSQRGTSSQVLALLKDAERYYDESDFSNLLKTLDMAILADYRNPELYFYRGCTNEDLGQLEEALDDFNRIALICPFNKHAKVLRTRILQKLGREE